MSRIPRAEFETTLRIHLRTLAANTSHLVLKVQKMGGQIVTFNQPWILGADGEPDVSATREAMIAQILADCYPPGAEPPEIQQQPDPVPADGDIWADILLDARHGRTVSPELYALMEARRKQGIARYGVPVQIGNMREARIDAIQEALDAIAYCECRRQQLAPTDPTGALGWSYAREDAERLAQRMLELP